MRKLSSLVGMHAACLACPSDRMDDAMAGGAMVRRKAAGPVIGINLVSVISYP